MTRNQMVVHDQTSAGTLRQWLGGAALLITAAVAAEVLDSRISLVSQSMFFVLAVVLAAYLFDWAVSIATSIVGVGALNFLFVPPRFTFEVDNRDHVLALTLMLIVALVTRFLASNLQRETRLARLSESRARQLQNLAVALSEGATIADIKRIGESALRESFKGRTALVLKNNLGQCSVPAVEQSIQDGLERCMKEGANLGPGTGRWPGLNAWFIPVMHSGEAVGAMYVASATAAEAASDDEGRDHAGAIASLLGQAAQRVQSLTSTREAWEVARRQQLQTTFLAGVAHDLRTPLTAIIGAASSLQTQSSSLSQGEQARMLDSIIGEAQYLVRVADNTLQLTRLQTGESSVPLDWESMEEIVGTVMNRARQHDPDRRLRASVAPSLPLVKADPILLGQLLFNLMDNALKYARGPVSLRVSAIGDALRIDVDDAGPRISAELREKIFLPHVRGDTDGVHGAGLGLAVCSAIAQVHGASLEVMSSPDGGNRFALVLPVTSAPAAIPEKVAS